MRELDKAFSQMVKEVAVDFAAEFDENFRRKAFFDKSWKKRFLQEKGSLMMMSGQLRRSLRKEVKGNTITFSSHLPYAEIHNEGGEIVVTEKMKRYFWYKFGATKLLGYKYLAMKRVGSKIVIPQRQFVGYHKTLDKIVEERAQEFVERAMKEVEKAAKRK